MIGVGISSHGGVGPIEVHIDYPVHALNLGERVAHGDDTVSAVHSLDALNFVSMDRPFP